MGNDLIYGDSWFNTTNNQTYIYTGDKWVWHKVFDAINEAQKNGIQLEYKPNNQSVVL